MPIEITDKSGQMREPKDFEEARAAIVKRMVRVGGAVQDVELFLQFPTIVQALDIAITVSRKAHSTEPSK